MQIKLRGNRVGVQKLKTKEDGASSQYADFLVVPESEEYLGHIRYVGEDADKNLRVGQKVYFTTNMQQCRMGGVDICVMADTEILAIVEEAT